MNTKTYRSRNYLRTTPTMPKQKKHLSMLKILKWYLKSQEKPGSGHVPGLPTQGPFESYLTIIVVLFVH